MQVSHAELADTHAVIGGAAPEAFGMAETAEFYTVLSDTLYQHKKLAAVREPICNGWDAHIKAGCTDRPLEITLTDTEVIFQDFGPGIPHNMVRTVYCVYGGSTKVLDKKQTGGFGLGSKAPFAYSDHFTVTVCHDGVKVIYAISRGGIETGGKPDIRPMVSVPTTETGVTVNIPLKKAEHRGVFEGNIKAVVKEGGILANLNGTLLSRVDYEVARKTGYLMMNGETPSRHGKVFVLSGTVIYPVSSNASESSPTVAKAASLMPQGYKLILIDDLNAPGIAPVPSREALSYSEITKSTLDKLAKRFLNDMMRHNPAQEDLFWDEAVSNFTNLRKYAKSPLLSVIKADTPEKCAAVLVRHRCTVPHRFEDNNVPALLAALARKLPQHKRVLRKMAGFAKTYKSNRPLSARPWHPTNRTSYLNAAFDKIAFDHELAPLMRVINAAGAHKFMRTFEVRHSGQTYVARNRGLGYYPVAKHIVLAQNRAEASLVLDKLSNKDYDTKTYICLFVPRRDTEMRDKIIAAATRLSIPLSITSPVPAKPREPKQAPPKKTYMGMSSFAEGVYSVTDPDCYLVVYGSHGDAATNLQRLPRSYLKARYGKIAVVRSTQMKALKDAGVPMLIDLVEKDLRKAKMSRNMLMGVLIARRSVIPGHNVEWTVTKLLEKHPELLFEFTNYKNVRRDKAMALAELFSALEALMMIAPSKTYTDDTVKFSEELVKEAKVMMCDEGPRSLDFYRTFEGIDTLSNRTATDITMPLVINFIRALKRANLEKMK